MASTSKRAGIFQAGDWVTFRYGTWNPVAQVAEDRGALGLKGRHLYRIRMFGESEEPDSFELPEDELNAAVPGKRAVVEYLRNGGLVEILRSNLAGGKNQPKAWLTFTARGELTYTIDPTRGIGGGAAVPFLALYDDKIFAPKGDEVERFLTTFELTPAEAAEVIAAVGVAP
jgi:hypothetical protein